MRQPSGAESETSPTSTGDGPEESSDDDTLRSPDVPLRSLAPKYAAGQHASYVRHLNEAVRNPKNKNIALTGRYGAGKSSILDRFEQDQPAEGRKVLRLSITALASDDDPTTTNHIQKELVKQLVYRAEPGEIKRSKFSRNAELTPGLSFLHAFVVATITTATLWIFNIRPDANAFGNDNATLPTAALFTSILAVAWILRWTIGNRKVAELNAGNASVSFAEEPDSYFDKYLDEITAFFEVSGIDIVIFEDLDRFDDPGIFESLRELNTLLNGTPQRAKQQQPLRFVYALKDSLFEKIEAFGVAPDPADTRDHAQKSLDRANRTKFFEIVIPVVPFLAFNNARDILEESIEALNLQQDTRIDRKLQEIVARHVTDMRLLLNICNEFVVFAERLLWVQSPAPEMTADHLFALVVYKNFHLGDFEKLAHSESALDTLETTRVDFVESRIQSIRKEEFKTYTMLTTGKIHTELARSLAERLRRILKVSGLPESTVDIDGRGFSSFEDPEFWRAITNAESVHTTDRFNQPVPLDHDWLEEFFPEAFEDGAWQEVSEIEISELTKDTASRISKLRGSDFADLYASDFVDDSGKRFSVKAEKVLPSKLALDLVTRGYIDKYYAEYASTFYGKFTGVDVAKFFRKSILPSRMMADFQFASEASVANVLQLAPASFYSSPSVLNVSIFQYLLNQTSTDTYLRNSITYISDSPPTGLSRSTSREDKAFLLNKRNEALSFLLVVAESREGRVFLEAYFNDDPKSATLMTLCLIKIEWSGLLIFLLENLDPKTDRNNRLGHLNIALSEIEDISRFDVPPDLRSFLQSYTRHLTALHAELPSYATENILRTIKELKVKFRSLAELSNSVRLASIEDCAYILNAENLRVAAELAESEAISLDALRDKPDPYNYCLAELDAYLSVVAKDPGTRFAVIAHETLASILSQDLEKATLDNVLPLLEQCNPSIALPNLQQIPKRFWPSLAELQLLDPSFENMAAYTTALGVDGAISVFLLAFKEHFRPGIFQDLDTERHLDLMSEVLNSKHLYASDRAEIARAFDPSPGEQLLPLATVQVTTGESMLAELLRNDLVPDTTETFQHFSPAGWNSTFDGLLASTKPTHVLSPGLVAGHVSDLLLEGVPQEITRHVLESLGDYVTDQEKDTLAHAAAAGRRLDFGLSPKQILRVASEQASIEDVLWHLNSTLDQLQPLEVMHVLLLLGRDYSGFMFGRDHVFEIDATPLSLAIMRWLEKNERIAFEKVTSPVVLRVRLL